MKPTLIVCRPGLIPFRQALQLQRSLQRRRIENELPDVLLLLEHPPVYTIGRAGNHHHLLRPHPNIELVRTDRGGDITYHGPGQLVGYFIIDLKKLYLDLRRFFHHVETALVDALAAFGISAGQHPRLRGVWVGRDKIAAMGIQVRRWVTMHGLALNVSNNLEPFSDIIPCGLTDCGVTSMRQLNCRVPIDAVCDALIAAVADRLHRRPQPMSLDQLVNNHRQALELLCPQR